MEDQKTNTGNTSKAGNLSKLKTAKDSNSDNGKSEESKVSKRELTEDQFAEYVKILADGKPHKIQDLLKVFDLPSTNAGREKLRKANTKINQTEGYGQVVPLFPEGITGKCFQLQK